MLLLETYKEAAVRSLADLENANLKGLLRRVIEGTDPTPEGNLVYPSLQGSTNWPC